MEPAGHDARIWIDAAAAAVRQLDFPEAARRAEIAVSIDGGSSEAFVLWSYALCQTGELSAAESVCRRALARDPHSTSVLLTLATILLAQGDPDAAESECNRCLGDEGAAGGAHEILGLVGRARGDVGSALVHFATAREKGRDTPGTRYNLATCHLLRNEYEPGFELFESRFDVYPQAYADGLPGVLATGAGRRWGGEDLCGRHLLLWAEQGIGDSIMMLRYLPMLRASGAQRVTVACHPALHRLVAEQGGVDVVDIADVAAGNCELHCPLLSLPFCLGTTATTVPGAHGYLAVPDRDRAHWAARIATASELKVGLVWAGSPNLRDDLRRSVLPEDMAVLLDVPGVRFVSLQKRDAVTPLPGVLRGVHDWMGECDDFASTAGLVAALDLVVSVDTAVAHLAGALGKPVWLLNRHGSEWRWGETGDRSVWYASMRQFRQTASGDWRTVLASVRANLLEHLRGSASCEPIAGGAGAA